MCSSQILLVRPKNGLHNFSPGTVAQARGPRSIFGGLECEIVFFVKFANRSTSVDELTLGKECSTVVHLLVHKNEGSFALSFKTFGPRSI